MAGIHDMKCDLHSKETVALCRTHHTCLCVTCMITKSHDMSDCKLIQMSDLREGDSVMMKLIGLKHTVMQRIASRSECVAHYETLKKRISSDMETFYIKLMTKLNDLNESSKKELDDNVDRKTQPLSKERKNLQDLEERIVKSIEELQPDVTSQDGKMTDHSLRKKYEKEIDEFALKLRDYKECAPNADGGFKGLKSLRQVLQESTLGKINIDDSAYEFMSVDGASDIYEGAAYQPVTIMKSEDQTKTVMDELQTKTPAVPERTYKQQEQDDTSHIKDKKNKLAKSADKRKSKPDLQVPNQGNQDKTKGAQSSADNMTSPEAIAVPKKQGKLKQLFSFGDKPKRKSVTTPEDTENPPLGPKGSVCVTADGRKCIELDLHKDKQDPCTLESMQTSSNGKIIILDSAHNTIIVVNLEGRVHLKTFEPTIVAVSASVNKKAEIAVLLAEGPVIKTLELSEDKLQDVGSIQVGQEITDIVGFDVDEEATEFAISTKSAVFIVKESGLEKISIQRLSTTTAAKELSAAFDFATRTQYILNIPNKSIKAYSFESQKFIWMKRVDEDTFEPHKLIFLKPKDEAQVKPGLFIICHDQLLNVNTSDGTVCEQKSDPAVTETLAVCFGPEKGTLLATKSAKDRVKATTINVLRLQK